MGYSIIGDSIGVLSVFQHAELLVQLDATGTRDVAPSAGSCEGSDGRPLVDVFACGRGFVTATQGGLVSMFAAGEESR